MDLHARAGRRITGGDHTPATASSGLPLASRTMTWHWRLEDPSGAAIDPASLGVDIPDADNQGDAESWLGENWRDLLARGVATVTLFNGEDEVYGPMGLAAT